MTGISSSCHNLTISCSLTKRSPCSALICYSKNPLFVFLAHFHIASMMRESPSSLDLSKPLCCLCFITDMSSLWLSLPSSVKEKANSLVNWVKQGEYQLFCKECSVFSMPHCRKLMPLSHLIGQPTDFSDL